MNCLQFDDLKKVCKRWKLYGTDFKKGSLQRYELAYDLSDGLLVKGGLIAYQSGATNGFGTIGDNDRLFLEFKYSF